MADYIPPCCSLEWPREHSIKRELCVAAYRLQTALQTLEVKSLIKDKR